MTRKATLCAWAEALGVNPGAEATVSQLEQAIEAAIASPPAAEQQYSLRDGLRNNARVIRAELPGTVRAIAANLFG